MMAARSAQPRVTRADGFVDDEERDACYAAFEADCRALDSELGSMPEPDLAGGKK